MAESTTSNPTEEATASKTEQQDRSPTMAENESARRRRTRNEKDWRVRRDRDNRRGNDRGRGRGRSHGDRSHHHTDGARRWIPRHENIISDPSTLEGSSDPDEMRKQVEFYFSDSNLPGDVFLSKQVGETNKPVPVNTIMKFKRMRRFDRNDVIAALHDSEFLNIAGEEGEETIQRKVPLDEVALARHTNRLEENNPSDPSYKRVIYIKGFPNENSRTQYDIEEWVKGFAPTNAVRLRRTRGGHFKGSIWCEFATEEGGQAMLAMELPEFNGKRVEKILSKEAYFKYKADQKKDRDSRDNNGEGKEVGPDATHAKHGAKRGRSSEGDEGEEVPAKMARTSSA